MWYQYLYLATLVACSAFALRRGGAPERLAIAIIVIGSILSVFAIVSGFSRVEYGLLVIDLIDQAALMWLMLRADRFWPIPVSALHLLAPLVGLAKGLVPMINPGIYARVEQGIGYILLLLITVGTQRHYLRLRRFGADPSWTNFSLQPGSRTARAGPVP